MREQLTGIGVNVRHIRLNGSAATHVLSDDINPAYKDLDLIFSIDFPDDEIDGLDLENGTYPRCEPLINLDDRDSRSLSDSTTRPTSLTGPKRKPCAKQSDIGACDIEVSLLDDSGYTSCESSISSAPPSPLTLPLSISNSLLSPRSRHRRDFRPRAGSLESSSSASSIIEDGRHRGSSLVLLQHLSQHQRDQCWQEIKDTVMGILLDYLPHGVNKSKMGSCVMANAYVDKMVKVAKESDKWSLISLNNDTGMRYILNSNIRTHHDIDFCK